MTALAELRRHVSPIELLHFAPPGALATVLRYVRDRRAGVVPPIEDAPA